MGDACCEEVGYNQSYFKMHAELLFNLIALLPMKDG